MSTNILGTGIKYPFHFENGKLPVAVAEDSVKSAIWFLLSSRKGARFMYPEFGTNIHRLLFEGIRPEVLQLVALYAKEAILEFIPRIRRVETQATPRLDEHRIDLVIQYWVQNSTVPEMMVYPFYLEGYRV